MRDMSGRAAKDSEWLRNFNSSAAELIQEERIGGYIVQGFVLTEGIYEKLADQLGYEPTDILGYLIEIVEQEDGEEDFIIIKKEPLN